MIGKAVPSYSSWGELDMNFETVAKIDAKSCIGCQLCVTACHDGAHQCIDPHEDPMIRVPVVDESECVGCNLCQIVCPVDGCISMALLRLRGTSTCKLAQSCDLKRARTDPRTRIATCDRNRSISRLWFLKNGTACPQAPCHFFLSKADKLSLRPLRRFLSKA